MGDNDNGKCQECGFRNEIRDIILCGHHTGPLAGERVDPDETCEEWKSD